jgi:transposase
LRRKDIRYGRGRRRRTGGGADRGAEFGQSRKKTEALEEALRGFFTDHHAMIRQMMLDNSDRISAQITELDARIEEAIGPFSRQAARLADIPGVNTVAAPS